MERFEQFWLRVIQKTFWYNDFKIHPLVKKKLFIVYSIFSSCSHFVQQSRTIWAILEEGHLRYSSIIFSKIHSLVKVEKSFKVFFFYFQFWWPFCSTEQNRLSNFGRGLIKEQSCEIILKSVHRFSRWNHLKLFSIYSPGGHFVQWSGTVRAILVEGHPRNIPV